MLFKWNVVEKSTLFIFVKLKARVMEWTSNAETIQASRILLTIGTKLTGSYLMRTCCWAQWVIRAAMPGHPRGSLNLAKDAPVPWVEPTLVFGALEWKTEEHFSQITFRALQHLGHRHAKYQLLFFFCLFNLI